MIRRQSYAMFAESIMRSMHESIFGLQLGERVKHPVRTMRQRAEQESARRPQARRILRLQLERTVCHNEDPPRTSLTEFAWPNPSSGARGAWGSALHGSVDDVCIDVTTGRKWQGHAQTPSFEVREQRSLCRIPTIEIADDVHGRGARRDVARIAPRCQKPGAAVQQRPGVARPSTGRPG